MTTETKTTRAPSASHGTERIEVLDAIRGLALLFVLLINSLYFGGVRSVELASQGLLDRVARVGLSIFVEHKGVGLFALLFGASAAMQIHRLRRGRSYATMVRRFVALFAFGLAHAWLLWTGDILRFLAVIGLLLLVFARIPQPSLRNCIAMVAITPLIVVLVLGAIGVASIDSPHEESAATASASDENGDAEPPVRKVGTYAETVAVRGANLLPSFGTLFVVSTRRGHLTAKLAPWQAPTSEGRCWRSCTGGRWTPPAI